MLNLLRLKNDGRTKRKGEGCKMKNEDNERILASILGKKYRFEIDGDIKVFTFKEVLEFLDEIEIPYNLNPYLVRGLDYYTKTVFEIFSETEVALAGGGRYDKLIKLLRGKDAPASGAAAGVERIINLMKVQDIKIAEKTEAQIFLAQLGSLAKRKSLKLLESFRRAKIKVEESFSKDSLKSQLNRADKIGAKYTLILGQKEALDGVVIIRDMKTGNQQIVKIDKAVERVKKKLK